MIPKNTTVYIAGMPHASDIRFVILDYVPEEDHYRLETKVSRHRFTVERVILHAQLRRKELVRERPGV